MKKLYQIAGLFAAVAVLGACSEDMYEDTSASEGQLTLELTNASATTRSSEVATDDGETVGTFDSEEVDVQNYTLIVEDASGVQQLSGVMSDLGANNGVLTQTLESGTYTATAYNYDGSSVNVSTRPWFKGTATGSVLPGTTTEMSVVASLQNVQVKVVPGESFLSNFDSDYSVTVDNGDGAVQIFTADNIANVYYFAVPEERSTLTVSVKATRTETGAFIQRTYTVEKPEDADGNSYIEAGDAFVINLIEDGSTLTYLDFGITVNFTFADQTESILIPTDQITYEEVEDGDSGDTEGEDDSDAITFTGLPAEYTNPASSGTDVVVTMEVPAGIANLYVTITSDNESFAATIESLGLSGTFDMANAGDPEEEGSVAYILTHSLESNEGIGLMSADDVIKGATSYTFDVTDFMSLLPLYGANNCVFTIKVVDANGNSKSGDLTVHITE